LAKNSVIPQLFRNALPFPNLAAFNKRPVPRTGLAATKSREILEIGGPSGTHDAPIVDKVMPRTAVLNKAKFGRRRFAT
jgi:hypothetical protein